MVITVDNISQVLMGADHVLCVSHLTHLILVPLLVEGGNYYLHLQMRKLRVGSVPASLFAKLRVSLGGDAKTIQPAQLVFLCPEHVLCAEQCFQHRRGHKR